MIERAEDLICRLRDVHSCMIMADETGQISEIHVVATTDRQPKMIARDVETCLKAELGISVDHRKIGVVLIDPMKETGVGKRRADGRMKGMALDDTQAEHIVESKLTESHRETDRSQLAELPRGPERDREISSGGEAALELLEEDVRVRFKGLSLNLGEDSVNVEVKLEKSGIEVIGCTGGVRTSGPVYETIASATIHALLELLDEDFNLCLSGIAEVKVSGRDALLAVVDKVEGRSVRSFAGCVFIGRDPNEAAVLGVLDAINRSLGRWKSRREVHYTIR